MPSLGPEADASSPPPGPTETPAAEGPARFHLALVLGVVPGASLLPAAIGWRRLRHTERPWARRIAALGVLDACVLAVLVVATLAHLPGAPSNDIVSGPIGPRPRIGVDLEDDRDGVRVSAVLPGSPAAAAGIRPGDRITHLDGTPLFARAELISGISGGGVVPHALTIEREGGALRIEVTPVIGHFALDAGQCTEVRPSAASTWAALTQPGTLLRLVALPALFGPLFVWGRRRGLAARESAKVLVPLVAALVVGPLLGSLLARFACPLFAGWDVRFVVLEALFAEIVLGALALALLAQHRGLAPSLRDEGPALGYLHTVGRGLLYVFAWMPRALLLATPLALLFGTGPLDDGRVTEIVSGFGDTPHTAALTFVTAALIAPIAEESLFRGVLAPHLGRLGDGLTAVLVTAVIFGVLHVGGHGWFFLGPLFLGGILGWARLRSGGLAAPITLHVLLNASAMAMSHALR